MKEILNLINNNLINGCANITGGGLSDNIKRIIPRWTNGKHRFRIKLKLKKFLIGLKKIIYQIKKC